MKIGRNDPCPCGSGKKYKKCCLNRMVASGPKMSVEFLQKEPTDFEYINFSAENISNVLKKYFFADAVMAVFCINLWRRNRSALAQALSMNLALANCEGNGTQEIKEYDQLKQFFDEIKEYIGLAGYEDYIIDDYGEVFLNHAGKTYPVITGTGHQQVYGALRYLQVLATNSGKDYELTTILEYTNTVLSLTAQANRTNDDNEIAYELPTEEFWVAIKALFANQKFQSQSLAVYQIMGHQFGPIERRYFVKKGQAIFPLYNSAILLDFYKILLENASAEEKEKHILQTLHTVIENSFNFSPNTPNRMLIAPVIIDSRTGKVIAKEGVIFAGFSRGRLLVAVKKAGIESTQLMKTIGTLAKAGTLRLVERYYRKECGGGYGADIDPNCEVHFMLIEPFTDITAHATWLEGDSQEFRCTALDALYIIGFSDDLDEVINFIQFETDDKMKILAFGGKNTLFFLWKNMNRHISQGAIEYDSVNVDFNETETFTYRRFKEQLSDFPRTGKGLFSDPLNWTVKDAPLGYKNFLHKGCHGFGGEVKLLGDNTYVFLAHNVELFNESDFSQNAHTALKTIDELNQRLCVRYAELISGLDILKGRYLQLLYVPWHYAEERTSYGYVHDSSRNIVFSDAYIEEHSFNIRYSVKLEELMDVIEEAPDRRGENQYFEELLRPLKEYCPEGYDELVNALRKDSPNKKTVGVFKVEQHYYYSDNALDTEIPSISFVKAKKEIAKVCMSSDVEPGEYRGKEATATIRKMQLNAIMEFEAYISELDKETLHKMCLNYLAVQQNGIILNMKRYMAFTGLDEASQLEFETSTRKIREEYRRLSETAKYLIESNLVVSRQGEFRKPLKGDFEYLLAFADWLVVLQDAADTCHYTDFDFVIFVDRDYKIETILNEATRERYDALLLRKYNTSDYHIKNDETDQAFLKEAIDAFNHDTGIDITLFIPLLEYMQLGAIQEGVAKEVYPNVFEADKELLVKRFNATLEEPVTELSNLLNILDFLTIKPYLLKNIESTKHDILPVWEREKRDNRFDVKPILSDGSKCIFSPVTIYNVLMSWKNGILDWYLPYEIGLPHLNDVLRRWKKRYEDEMVKDIEELFNSANFDLVIPEMELYRRFPKEKYPQELGDYDVFAINRSRHQIWIIESKVLQKVGSIYEDQMQQRSFFYQHKDDERFQKRINFMKNHTTKVLNSFGIEGSDYAVVPYMVTNKLFMSRYKQIEFPIITFSELQELLAFPQ